MSVLMPQSSSLVACGVSADVNQNWSSKRQQGKPVLCHCGSLSMWNKSIWNTGISFCSVLGCSFLFVFSLVKAVNEFQEGSFSYIVFFFFCELSWLHSYCLVLPRGTYSLRVLVLGRLEGLGPRTWK